MFARSAALAITLGFASTTWAAGFGPVHTELVTSCKPCHRATGTGAGAFALTGQAAADHAAVKPLASLLIPRAEGGDHPKVWEPSSTQVERTRAWLNAGARLRAGGKRTFSGIPFAPAVHGRLIRDCQRCHRGRGLGSGGWTLTGEVKADFAAVKPRADKLLVRAGGGEGHLPIWSSSEQRALVRAWVEDGARLGPLPGPPTPAVKRVDTVARPAVELGVDPNEPPLEGPDGSADFKEVHALLRERCIDCHNADRAGGFIAHEDPTDFFAAVRPYVTRADPGASLLLQRPIGNDHPSVLNAREAARLESWINAGAPGPEAADPNAPPDPALEAPSPEAVPPPPPLLTSLLDGVSLHGRFDLNYERRGFSDNPFAEGAKNALRSYHHFLFLGRHTDDAFSLDLELTSLLFWEIGYRLTPKRAPVRATATVGKLFVPFGASPLFHHSYGGLAGFDQKVLPAVWAQEGARLAAHTRIGPVGLTGDVYVVAGFGLRDEDDVIDLQVDASPLDDAQPATGGRLGASWGPIAGWYSMLLDPLGHDRLLYLQALDVSLARARGVPVLENVSAAAGLLRGDVSGGGPGSDHYLFASYFQLRYHPVNEFYVQYRQGLRTFDNRGGVIFDSRRATARDGSTHSLAAVTTWKGLSAGLWYFWNLEKVDEVDDDFFRVTVAYAF